MDKNKKLAKISAILNIAGNLLLLLILSDTFVYRFFYYSYYLIEDLIRFGFKFLIDPSVIAFLSTNVFTIILMALCLTSISFSISSLTNLENPTINNRKTKISLLIYSIVNFITPIFIPYFIYSTTVNYYYSDPTLMGNILVILTVVAGITFALISSILAFVSMKKLKKQNIEQPIQTIQE